MVVEHHICQSGVLTPEGATVMMVQTPYGSGHLAPESDVNVVTSHHYVLYGFLTPGCNGCTGEITSLWIVWCGRPWFYGVSSPLYVLYHGFISLSSGL
jgi:hypothetical protein